ncbi:hypothetical protein T07_13421, partial [Trichinella nelsoni]
MQYYVRTSITLVWLWHAMHVTYMVNGNCRVSFVLLLLLTFSNLRCFMLISLCFREKNLHNNAILRSTSHAEEEEIEWTFFYVHINEYESVRFRKLTDSTTISTIN